MALAAGGTLTVAGADLVFGAIGSPEAAAAAETARAVPSEPRIYSRGEWGAAPVRRPATLVPRNPDRIVIHHTASPNSADYSLQHAFALSRAIQGFHMRRRGWDDTGQHFTISRGGFILEGRNRTLAVIRAHRQVAGLAGTAVIRDRGFAMGAHTRHHNDHTIGIECEGTYARTRIPLALWGSLSRLCAWLCGVYGLDPARAIIGHRDLNQTGCPGGVLYASLPALRRNVVALLS